MARVLLLANMYCKVLMASLSLVPQHLSNPLPDCLVTASWCLQGALTSLVSHSPLTTELPLPLPLQVPVVTEQVARGPGVLDTAARVASGAAATGAGVALGAAGLAGQAAGGRLGGS